MLLERVLCSFNPNIVVHSADCFFFFPFFSSGPVQIFAFVSDPKIYSYLIITSMIMLKLYETPWTALIVTPVQYYNWPVLSRFSPKEFMKTGKRMPRALLNPIVRITHKVVSPQTNHDHRLSCLNVTIIPPKRFIVIPISDQKALVSSACLRTSLCKNQTSWEMKIFNPPSNFACS